ncbi:MAG TPA: GNAT family N-acetyltransferase [Candidatus Acidoferrales bacterium]|nr:GNAT family N-acetyltransferase [Candidatus Acidoferrales bacterium]
MKFMDLELACRVEMAEAAATRACAEAALRLHPEHAIAVAEIAGGIAAFAGADSPVTQAIGVGLGGPVSAADLDRLEEFFHSRGASTAMEICPLVDISLYQELARRGYHLAEVSNVLVRELCPEEVIEMPELAPRSPAVVVRPAASEEADLWTLTVAQGFAEHFPVTQSILDVMMGFFYREDAACFLAFINGEVGGGGAVAEHGRVGGLFGASTLPAFRRRGVQSALLAARLAWARDMVATSSPASLCRAAFRNATSNASAFALPIPAQKWCTTNSEY